MTTPLPEATPLLTGHPQGCPFDPTVELGQLRAEAPLSRLQYPDGHVGWLVTSHTLVRAVMSDPRFSSRLEFMHDPFAMPYPMELSPEELAQMQPPAPPIGDLTGIDPPEHTRYRRVLAGKFTVRRMRALTDRVEQIAAEHLDLMENSDADSVDLLDAYARPISALTICELLGAPVADREHFVHLTNTMAGMEVPLEERFEAFTAMGEYIQKLVVAKRANPTDDVLSEMTTSDLTDEEIAGIGAYLLASGMDSTAQMIALGTWALMTNPGQLALLKAEPGIADQAVDELLRYLSATHTAVRSALEDLELAGQVIKKGESVTVSLQGANRDPAQYPDPDLLDLRRTATEQVAFGHGIHTCLGQNLARVQMRVGYQALFARFPTLRLAVRPEEIVLTNDAAMHGVQRLPVTWDKA